MFYNSQSDAEKSHLTDALCFELGKVNAQPVRERMIRILSYVDKGLAAEVAYALGLEVPKDDTTPLNFGVPADAPPGSYEPLIKEPSVERSEALSMAATIKDSIRTRQIAVLAAEGVNATQLNAMKTGLQAAGATVEIIAPRQGMLQAADDTEIPVDKSLLTAASVFYDAVYIPGGTMSVATLAGDADAVHFLNEAFKHCKAIAADEDARQVLEATNFAKKLPEDFEDETVLTEGVVIGNDSKILARQFIAAVARHRFWDREKARKVPA